MISRLEHIPEEGEEFAFQCQGYLFRILTVKDRMIQSVLASKVTPPGADEENNDMVVEETEEK